MQLNNPNGGFETNVNIALDMGGGGSQPLTPSQPAGPYYPVVDFFDVGNILITNDGLITSDSVFRECRKLKHANLVEGELHETIDALQLDDWRNDIYEEIESINQILPNAFGGIYNILGRVYAAGEKAQVIREWVRSVLRKIIHYQAEHQRLLNEAGSTLHHALPHVIVMNDVLSFLKLPSHTFELED